MTNKQENNIFALNSLQVENNLHGIGILTNRIYVIVQQIPF